MPLLCYGDRRSPTQLDEDEDDVGNSASIWQEMPDSILLQIFSSLSLADLGVAGTVCKTWHRISLDETLWKALFVQHTEVKGSQLAEGKTSWREEVKRIYYHAPVVLTEKLTNHIDEVLHVSFSHDGRLFSTTSKDATLKIWEMGYPTRLRYSEDFRAWLEWDFTQFSCFNESDTMVLVSSVKSTDIMDRRGYMAILSIVNDFEVLRIVTMDPSQLFGAWLDDRTFLGGSLEISLDRFATTVRIEAYEVPDKASEGAPVLFTFSSETASLIKFLTVCRSLPDTDEEEEKEENKTTQSTKPGSAEQRSCGLDGESSGEIFGGNSETKCTDGGNSVQLSSGKETLNKSADRPKLSADIQPEACGSGTGPVGRNVRIKPDMSHKESMELDAEELAMSVTDRNKEEKKGEIKCWKCSKCKFSSSNHDKESESLCNDCLKSHKISSKERVEEIEMEELTDLKDEMPVGIDQVAISVDSDSKIDTGLEKEPSKADMVTDKLKNLIFVTGEFAVALHQLGFKNIPPSRRISALSGEGTLFDGNAEEGYNMVVNYSNNDIHLVQRSHVPDKPDHLIDLNGHVTGLCLSADHRFLFINCRPWVGEIDRTDPWATPELLPNIEVRIIDLKSLKDLGVRYTGHKGFSPSNMCCFVFLDVSQDYVASGSEDAKGYLWDRHYRCLLTNYHHDSGVVNAVAFSPSNQEYLVTASDDKTLKVWRSRAEVKRLGIPVPFDEERLRLDESST